MSNATPRWSTSAASAMSELRHVHRGKHYSSTSMSTKSYSAVLRVARSIVEESGVCQDLERWQREDRAASGRHPGGRPATLSFTTLLTVHLAQALLRKTHLHRHLADTLSATYEPEHLALVGAPAREFEAASTYYLAYRRFRTIEDLIDPTPGPRRHSLLKTELAELRAERALEPNASLLAQKEERRETFVNKIITASRQVLPRRIRRHSPGLFAVDATHVPLPGRPDRGRSRWAPTIYDGGWYVRDTGDGHGHDGTPTKGKGRREKYVWALEFEIVVAGNRSYDQQDSPLLVHGMNIHRPSAHPAESAAKTFALMAQLDPDQPREFIAADRLYLPNAKPETFQGPMRQLGYSFAMDYPANQLGVQDQYAGAPLVDGSFYCPAMPKDLVEATAQHARGLIDDKLRDARIEARTPYLLQKKEQSTMRRGAQLPDQKYRCPAAGPSPTVHCPLKPNPRGNPAKTILPAMLPQHPDKVCTNKESITIPGTAGLKTRQDVQYKTAEWKSLYHGPRSKVESINNQLKSATQEDFGAPGGRLARSVTAQAIFGALRLAALNCSRVFAFLSTYVEPEQEPPILDPETQSSSNTATSPSDASCAHRAPP